MGRLLLVSNRLPVTVRTEAKRVAVVPSSGGLASGLRGPHVRSKGLWIGWPGDVSRLNAEQIKTVERELESMGTLPIYLTPSEVSRYYDGFANGVLWPIFHYLSDRVPIDAHDWEAYKRVNARFADVVAAQYRQGDLVWIHDYQLMLVPAMLRARLPRAKIGFFLHIPFPASDVFRILPWREQVLEGLLGADLIGFHTYGYMRHFAKAAVRTLGVGFDVDTIPYRGRDVKLGVFPMGIDAEDFERVAESDDVRAQVEVIKRDAQGQKILLGIDRLDYTKGIGRRLLAMERLLEREPQLRGHVRLIQIAVPSREKVAAYATFRRQVDETVGRINGAYGSVNAVPIHYLYRSFSMSQVAALYRAADAMLVTPLRDGMNLVAKEFVAARTDGDGVLVLSEFAGAFSELGEAVPVNPYDIDGMASAYKRALTMPEAERRERMRALRKRVRTHDVHGWAESFIRALDDKRIAVGREMSDTSPEDLREVLTTIAAAPSVIILLDYDGTLRKLVSSPELAVPPQGLIALLGALAERKNTEVHLVSGRTRESLEGWFGLLPTALHAEHGAWSRPVGGQWRIVREISSDWKEQLRPIFDEFTYRTPGSRVEEKSTTFAWHYRMADPEFGPSQARELSVHLTDILTNTPVEVLHGEKVVEVRQHGVHKGIVVEQILATRDDVPLIVAIGDDRTDEDMFAALPQTGIAIHVGTAPTNARYRLADPAAVLAFLLAITDQKAGTVAAES